MKNVTFYLNSEQKRQKAVDKIMEIHGRTSTGKASVDQIAALASESPTNLIRASLQLNMTQMIE